MARRQASVATDRDSETLRRRSLSAQIAERAHCAVHRIVAKFAAARQALAEADDARESIDDREAALGRPRNQQAGNCWCQDRSRHKCDDAALAVARSLGSDGLPCRFVILLQGRRTGDTLRHVHARFCPSPPESSG